MTRWLEFKAMEKKENLYPGAADKCPSRPGGEQQAVLTSDHREFNVHCAAEYCD